MASTDMETVLEQVVRYTEAERTDEDELTHIIDDVIPPFVQTLKSIVEQLTEDKMKSAIAEAFEEVKNALKEDVTTFVTDHTHHCFMMMRELVTKQIESEFDMRMAGFEPTPLEGLTKSDVLASCIANRKMRIVDEKIQNVQKEMDIVKSDQVLLRERHGTHEAGMTYNNDYFQAKLLKNSDAIKTCWEAKEGLCDVLQQLNFKNAMLEERVRMLEEGSNDKAA